MPDQEFLRKAGPQRFNQIAGTFKEQLARVHQPREVRPVSRTTVRRIIASAELNNDLSEPALKRLVARLMADMLANNIRHRRGGRHES